MATNDKLKGIRQTLEQREKTRLSPFAAKSDDALRLVPEPILEKGYRQAYSTDADRILHSMAYTRYIDKTQVFYLIENDHITHRVLHVQLVSKIARTIGRFLELNEDLIEAVALGHDIGHTPFGHDGERFLSRLCREHGIGHFLHNVQSVRFLSRLERKGRGWNLCLATLDGILCHDGEIHQSKLSPGSPKTFQALDMEMAQKTKDPGTRLVPMTLEGCVVRLADTISYIGRDVEDAIRLGVIKRSDIPASITDVLGNTNGTIVHTLVTDVIEQSFHKPFVAFSPDISNALKALKEFNLEHIYFNEKIKKHLDTIGRLFHLLFERFLKDLKTNNTKSVIHTGFLANMSQKYLKESRPEEIVRDFIAGMTDKYFLRQCPENQRPESMPLG